MIQLIIFNVKIFNGQDVGKVKLNDKRFWYLLLNFNVRYTRYVNLG